MSGNSAPLLNPKTVISLPLDSVYFPGLLVNQPRVGHLPSHLHQAPVAPDELSQVELRQVRIGPQALPLSSQSPFDHLSVKYVAITLTEGRFEPLCQVEHFFIIIGHVRAVGVLSVVPEQLAGEGKEVEGDRGAVGMQYSPHPQDVNGKIVRAEVSLGLVHQQGSDFLEVAPLGLRPKQRHAEQSDHRNGILILLIDVDIEVKSLNVAQVFLLMAENGLLEGLFSDQTLDQFDCQDMDKGIQHREETG